MQHVPLPSSAAGRPRALPRAGAPGGGAAGVGFGVEEVVEGVPDGFFCPCHGSKFDMAGRVFQNVPAPLNLVVPPYQFVDDTTIIIGSEAEVA